MKQKIFLKKGSRVGKTSSTSGSSLFSFRNVFKFVVIILFWAAFIPLLWHQKTKNAEDKATGAKVVKEVPKSPQPAASGESSTPPAASPVQPAVTVPAAVPPPPAAKVDPAKAEPAKAEPAKVTASEPPPTNEPVAGRAQDQAKPPLMPVPEAKPAAPSLGSTPVAQGVSGVVSAQKPGEVLQGVAAAKPVTGTGSTPAGSIKPGDKIAAGAKSKPLAGSGSPDKTKPVVGSGASPEVPTAKPTDPGAEQPKKATDQTRVTKQKAPVKIARADGRPPAAAAAAKPAAPSAPATTPPPAPSPPADKPKESLQEANWVYIVHLGSFQNPSQAQELQKRLQKKGYAAVVKSQLNLQKGKVYNVELTSVQDAAEARTKMNKLQAEEQLNPVLLKVMGKH
jgi:cell division septation protein DedD